MLTIFKIWSAGEDRDKYDRGEGRGETRGKVEVKSVPKRFFVAGWICVFL